MKSRYPLRFFAARWFGGRLGWFVRVGRLSVAWVADPLARSHRLVTERYGSGRSWTLGRLRFRYHGRLYPIREWKR